MPVSPVLFDGTNDYLSSATMTGAADTQSISGYFKFESAVSGGNYDLHDTTGDSVLVRINTAGRLQITLKNSAGTSIVVKYSNTTDIASGLHECFWSYDGAAGVIQIYIDGVSNLAGFGTLTTGTVDMTTAAYTVCANPFGNNKFNGTMYRVCIWDNVVLDCSSSTVRANMADETQAGTLGNNIVDMYGVASVWNAGTTSGTGSNYTMNGAVTDVGGFQPAWAVNANGIIQ